MKHIMTDRDIWPMLCKAMPVLADIPLVTGMTLDLALESRKVPLVSVTYHTKDDSNTECLAVKTYRLQQNGEDVSVDNFFNDLCRAFPALKGLTVTKLTLRVAVHQLVTMDIECEVPPPKGDRILAQTYELAEVKA